MKKLVKGFQKGNQYGKANRIYEDSALGRIFREYRQSAIGKRISFDLDFPQFENLVRGNCYYCGREPSLKKKLLVCSKEYYIFHTLANGIDRVDNKLGYVLNNCVSCCDICNYMKSDLPVEDFLRHIITIYEYSNLKDKEYV